MAAPSASVPLLTGLSHIVVPAGPDRAAVTAEFYQSVFQFEPIHRGPLTEAATTGAHPRRDAASGRSTRKPLTKKSPAVRREAATGGGCHHAQ